MHVVTVLAFVTYTVNIIKALHDTWCKHYNTFYDFTVYVSSIEIHIGDKLNVTPFLVVLFNMHVLNKQNTTRKELNVYSSYIMYTYMYVCIII